MNTNKSSYKTYDDLPLMLVTVLSGKGIELVSGIGADAGVGRYTQLEVLWLICGLNHNNTLLF